MAKNNNLTDFLTDVANAIRAKKGTTAKINPQNFSSEIASIETSSGGSSNVGSAAASDVNFFDYDGTILYSYSASEFSALSALPDLPSHDGLTCQGWNYTLTEAKSYVSSYGTLDIGAMYITDDGATRLYIRIVAEGRMTVPLYFSQTVAKGVTIDWGDGSATKTLSGTGDQNTSHTYSSIGDYVISLKVTSGTLGLGDSLSSYCVMGSTAIRSRVYCNMLQKVEIGSGVTSIGGYAFSSCSSLASVNIPSGVTSIGSYAFYNCYSLASVNIPSGVTSIGSYAFSCCYSLASVTIPSSVTSIDSYAFSSCYSLASVTIPSSVTSIDSYAFYNCYSLASVNIPSGVTSIDSYAFSSCYSLASVTIPSSVTSIGDRTFYNCYSLASVNIPSGVTSIGSYAFNSCYSLASVNIPSSVTSIGDRTFYNCYGMAFYDFSQHTSVPTLSDKNAFSSIPSDCVIKVPSSLLSEWKAATNWSTYASKIIAG